MSRKFIVNNHYQYRKNRSSETKTKSIDSNRNSPKTSAKAIRVIPFEKLSESNSNISNHPNMQKSIRIKNDSEICSNEKHRLGSDARNVIVLSDMDVNRESTSQATDGNGNLFQLTSEELVPELYISDSQKSFNKLEERKLKELPPKSYNII